jgi:hypothetical protein
VTEGVTQGVTQGVTGSVLHPVLAGVPRYWAAGLRSVGVSECDCVADVASGSVVWLCSGRALRHGLWPAIPQQGFLAGRFGSTSQAQPSPPFGGQRRFSTPAPPIVQ